MTDLENGTDGEEKRGKLEEPGQRDKPLAVGPLSAELRLRQAVGSVERAFLCGRTAGATDTLAWYRAVAGSVMLALARDGGGAAEMCRAVNSFRVLFGSVNDWDGDARYALMSLEAAYNVALTARERSECVQCYVRHAKTGLYLVARHNGQADGSGLVSMRWMGKSHADPASRPKCEALAAAWNALAGEDEAQAAAWNALAGEGGAQAAAWNALAGEGGARVEEAG